MSIYDELKDVAKGVLTEFKQGTITLIKITAGAGPRDNPGAPTRTPHIFEGAVAKGVGYKLLQNALVQATDLEVVGNVIEGVTPTLKDFIEIDGKQYKIVLIQLVPPAGTTVVWKFVVRAG